MGGACNAWRRSRCGSLATLPGAAFRPPPLTPAPFAERLRSMASSSRHRSSVVAGRGPLAPGRRAPSCDAPCRSRLLGVGSTGALRVLGQSLAGHVALGGFGPSTPASPIFPRGGVFESARGHQRNIEPGTATVPGSSGLKAGFGPSTPASPISPRGSFRIRPGAPEKQQVRW